MESQKVQDEECCPPFDPAPWENKIIEWDNKKFIKDKVQTFFFMPVTFGKMMKRLDEKTRSAGVTIQDGICLSDHTSKWNMDLYLAVEKVVPGCENTTISGKFFSKVYEGPFRDTGKWCKDFESVATGKGMKIKKWYMWYTTCPKCTKKYGKNYVVILGQIE